MPFLGQSVKTFRRERLYALMDMYKVDALLFQSPEWIEFASNHAVTVQGWERPFAFVLTRSGEAMAILHDLSSMKAAQALERGVLWANKLVCYSEVPHIANRRPLLQQLPDLVADVLQQLKLGSARIGFDAQPAYLPGLVATMPGLAAVSVLRELKKTRLVKHADEIALLQEAARLSDWAVERYRELLRPGKVLQQLDHQIAGDTCAEAGSRFPGEDFQILRFMTLCGAASACAHGDGFQSGARAPSDTTAVTICNVRLNGMSMENQRTFVLGKVDPQRERLMKVALDANLAGLEAAVAGQQVSSIDAASQSTIAAAGVDEYVLHRTGHGIGVATHEYPEDMSISFRPMLADEVMIVEPGIYVPGVGGFRYVDAVVVGPQSRVLTQAPKDFESMCLS